MATTRVQLPDGNIGEFPAGMKPEDIQAVLSKQFPAPEKPSPGPGLTGISSQSDTPAHAVQDVFGNIGAGGIGALETMGRISPWGAAYDASMDKPTIYGEAIDAAKHPWETVKGAVKGFAEHPLGTIEQGIGAAAVGGLAKFGNEGVANMRDPVRAYRSPLIPENEAIARAATDVLKPNPLEYRGMVKSLSTRLPEAKEYLGRYGINKPSPVEFAKGAEGAGKEASGFYQQHLIQPNAEVPVGSGTVSSNYARLNELNDKLRPIYRARSMGEQMTKEAQDNMANMERERDLINNNLYKTLGERSGLPEEQVRDINQRGAQLQHVGDVTDSAQAARRLGNSGYSPMGIPTKADLITRAVNLFRDPEAAAGRKLGRIMNQVNEPARPLPDPAAIEANRARMAMSQQQTENANRAASIARKPAGMGPTEPPQAMPISPGPEYAENFAARRQAQRAGINQQADAARAAQEAATARAQANQAARGARKVGLTPTQPPTAEVIPPPDNYTRAVLEGAKRRSVPEPIPKANPLDKYLGPAREGQSQARTLIRRKQ